MFKDRVFPKSKINIFEETNAESAVLNPKSIFLQKVRIFYNNIFPEKDFLNQRRFGTLGFVTDGIRSCCCLMPTEYIFSEDQKPHFRRKLTEVVVFIPKEICLPLALILSESYSEDILSIAVQN